MKPEVLVQKQFEEAQAAWKAEKHALQAEINTLKEQVVSVNLKKLAADTAAAATEAKKDQAKAEQEKTREKKAAKADAKAASSKKAAKK